MSGGRLPVVAGRDVIRALRKLGFGNGSGPRGRDLKPGTLRSIIRQAGLTVEEFARLV
jgi:predicted RNA binding protein YcfA (HicA-like mRNA interferase family)